MSFTTTAVLMVVGYEPRRVKTSPTTNNGVHPMRNKPNLLMISIIADEEMGSSRAIGSQFLTNFTFVACEF